MSPKIIIDILGWTGSVLYLLAYALVSLRKTEGNSVLYQGISIVAGTLLVVYTLSLGAFRHNWSQHRLGRHRCVYTWTKMAYTKPTQRSTPGAQVEQILQSTHNQAYRLSIPAGKADRYRLAQLDDYAQIPKE